MVHGLGRNVVIQYRYIVAMTALGCTERVEKHVGSTVHFLRDAVQEDGGPVEPLAWSPGEAVRGAVAPLLPECRPQFSVDLEDRRADAEQGLPPAGMALAFSPDGHALAIGSAGGLVALVKVPGGEVIGRRQLAEGAVKDLRFSVDGTVLYVGEQSPDAYLYALDPATLTERWKFRLADDLESSAMPAGDPMYGRYSLPGAFGITALADGRVIIAGAHGWGVEGARRNRSRLWVLAADGSVLAAFPKDHAADAIFMYPSVAQADAGAGDVLLGISRSAAGPDPGDLPVGGVVDLALPDLTPRWTRAFEPLLPYFKTVFFWEAVTRGPRFAFAGLGDGRAFVLDDEGQIRATLQPGVPIVAGGVPVGVGVGFATARAEGIWYLTTSTNIPWGSADPSARPPEAHPAENTVHALGPDGSPRWDRALRQSVAGIVASPDGTELLVGAGPRESDTRTDLFGAVVLSASSGQVVTTCSTASPVDFRPVWAPDGGWIAVGEAPFRAADGAVAGAYRVTVFR